MAANGEINGNDLLILIDRTGTGTYVAVGCLTKNSLDSKNPAIDVSSKCFPTGKWIPGSKIEQTLTGEGFALDQDGANTLNSYTQLYNLHVQQAVFPVKFGKVVPTTGDAIFAGTAFITDFKLDAPFNAAATFTITMQVNLTALVETVSY